MDSPCPWWRNPFLLITLAIAIPVGWYAWTEHGRHLAAWFPFLVILACPLMHLFHHGHHGMQRHSDNGKRGEP